MKEYHYK